MKAYEILDRKERWCKRTLARTAAGTACSIISSGAVSFSLVGAILLAHSGNSIFDRLAEAAKAVGCKCRRGAYCRCLDKWNDAAGRTFEEVRQLLIQKDL